MKFSSPSFSEIELTMGLPCTHFSPASMMLHFEESIIIGTFEMSGSEATRLRNFAIAASPSSIASSMLMSITCAPVSTCCLATSSASSYWPSRIRRLNLAEPVTLARSPTLTNSESSPTLNGSSPDRRSFFSMAGILRGGTSFSASAIALICAGEVPQQPPAILRKPLVANSLTRRAVFSGSSS